MQKKAERDLSFDLTQGGILQKLLVVALPIVGSQFMQMFYNLTDMFWLGRLENSDAVAASGSVGMYIWMSVAFMVLGARGAEIGVSQNTGKNDLTAAKEIGQSSVMLSGLLGLLTMVVYIAFNRPMIDFFAIVDPNVAAMARSYLIIVSIGSPFTFSTMAIAGVFSGSGNSRTPFYISLLSLILNMALDPLLIIVWGMGIEGAAIATVAAQVVGAVLLAVSLAKGKRRPFQNFRLFSRLKKDHVRTIFRWTTPLAIESFLFTFLTMIISRLVASFGTSAMAAQRVSSQVESLSWLIAGGFSSALTAFVGQNFGAGKWGRIHRGLKISTVAMIAWGAVITSVMLFFGGFICRFFLPSDAEAVEIGRAYLRILAMCQLLACLEVIAAGAFRGLGVTLPPSIVSVVCNAARAALAMFLMGTPLQLNGIWIAITVGAAVRGLWMYLWYKKVARTKPKGDDFKVCDGITANT